MHEHPSHSSFIGGKGTGGQKGRQYFGYPGKDPNSPSQQIQIPRSPWNFAMCCFHGLARCPYIARNIKMHFFTKHLLWLTHAGVIPCVKTNDISRILSENGISRISSKKWYLYSYKRLSWWWWCVCHPSFLTIRSTSNGCEVSCGIFAIITHFSALICRKPIIILKATTSLPHIIK